MIQSVSARALCIFILFALDAAVANSPPPVPQPGKGPCIADLEKFCPKVPIGEGRRIICLEKHQSQLAPMCAKRVPAMRKMFNMGQESKRRTEEYLAKKDAEEKATGSKAQQAPAVPSKPK